MDLHKIAFRVAILLGSIRVDGFTGEIWTWSEWESQEGEGEVNINGQRVKISWTCSTGNRGCTYDIDPKSSLDEYELASALDHYFSVDLPPDEFREAGEYHAIYKDGELIEADDGGGLSSDPP